MKRDEILKGGLNALLGGSTTQAATTAKEPDPSPIDEAETSTPQEEEELISSVEDEELREALRKKRMQKRGRPRKSEALRAKEAEIYTRSTWIMRRDHLSKLKEISFRETLTLKDIMEQIVGDAIAAYEQKHGEVKPTDHRGDASKVFK